jgi:hypothetical protein
LRGDTVKNSVLDPQSGRRGAPWDEVVELKETTVVCVVEVD